jgi:hypothetical protein
VVCKGAIPEKDQPKPGATLGPIYIVDPGPGPNWCYLVPVMPHVQCAPVGDPVTLDWGDGSESPVTPAFNEIEATHLVCFDRRGGLGYVVLSAPCGTQAAVWYSLPVE